MTAAATAPARVRRANERPANPRGDYVLYWIQAYRRLERNHALDYALQQADALGKPLAVYEGLRLDYPWASARLHRFVLEGMAESVATARAGGITYWPFVATPSDAGRGLVHRLAARAALVVTDDSPCFVVPEQTAALAARASVAVFAVDSNGVVPLSRLGPPVGAAAHLRPRIHKTFADAWRERAAATPRVSATAAQRVAAPFDLWRPPRDMDAFVASLGVDATVRAVDGTRGGASQARRRLAAFLKRGLPGYADERSTPAAPADGHASGLSPYLHFGHVSIEEIAGRVLHGATLPLDRAGRKEFFGDDPDRAAFLDEALTWRDVGFHWHWSRRADAARLETALPPWALATLDRHRGDRRAHVYTRDEWEAAATHDPLWNAAQRELVATGTIHNYLRMLWGKKVIEWSGTPEDAYATLVHLNNKYALDGRDPNSWTGILWCFGLFDRPWGPERPVLGVVRYMSSENTARKFRLRPYLEYVASLPR